MEVYTFKYDQLTNTFNSAHSDAVHKIVMKCRFGVFFNICYHFPGDKCLNTSLSSGHILGKSTEPVHIQMGRTGSGGGPVGRTMGRGTREWPGSGDPYGCRGNPPQLSAEAARLRYLRGNSRGRRREVFGVASPQRAQLPQDRGKECEGVT